MGVGMGAGAGDGHGHGRRDGGAPADWGYSDDRGAESEDKAYRKAYGRGRPSSGGPLLRSAYHGIVGDCPQLAPGDRQGAEAALARVEQALEHGYANPGCWTRNEWSRLYRMRDKWQRRAAGEDDRFNRTGNRPGRRGEAGGGGDGGVGRAMERVWRTLDGDGDGDGETD